jgi:hypothetical protein
VSHPNYTPPKSKKKPSVLLIVVLVLFCSVAACICGVAVATSSSDKKPGASTTTAAARQPGACEHGTLPNGSCAEAGTPQSTVIVGTVQAPPPAPTTKAVPAVPTITDGTWTVGEDFPAGTYKTVGAGSTCYWAITKSGTNGSDIVDNHIGGGNLRVTLKAGQDFETDRCGTWAKV